jgi:hypothetical protein
VALDDVRPLLPGFDPSSRSGLNMVSAASI